MVAKPLDRSEAEGVIAMIEAWGTFLNSPENFSGLKSQMSHCDPLVLKSLWCFDMFLM